jgi:hypothetical protein
VRFDVCYFRRGPLHRKLFFLLRFWKIQSECLRKYFNLRAWKFTGRDNVQRCFSSHAKSQDISGLTLFYKVVLNEAQIY